MISLENVDLTKKNTFHLHSVAANYYIPESESDLAILAKQLGGEKYYILGGGSNLLIRDDVKIANVISAELVDMRLEHLGSGRYYCGSSVKIQSLINYVNENGHGGIEELYCLPALFGGIIAMNAGVGLEKKQRFCIGQFVESVRVCDLSTGEIFDILTEECSFSYRYSVFQNGRYYIIGAVIVLPMQDVNVSRKRIADRVSWVKENQEWGKGCFGTCFSTANPRILKLASCFTARSSGVCQSKNNVNWLVNTGEGTYSDAMKIIRRVQSLHKLLNCECDLEVRVWD